MIDRKEISAEDLVDASYDRINEVDDQIGAFLTLDEESARSQAKQLDAESDKEARLFGIPAGIKDNIVTKDLRTTCGSQFLRNFDNPLYNATVVDKLQAEKYHHRKVEYG